MNTESRNKLTMNDSKTDTNATMRKPRKVSGRKDVPFGKILSAIMKERGLTLKQISQMAGVSLSVVSDWTAGNSPRDLQAVYRLSQALGIEFSRLLLGQAEPIKDISSVAELFDEDEIFDGLVRINIKRVSLRDNKK